MNNDEKALDREGLRQELRDRQRRIIDFKDSINNTEIAGSDWSRQEINALEVLQAQTRQDLSDLDD
jgi:hypothetical protein